MEVCIPAHITVSVRLSECTLNRDDQNSDVMETVKWTNESIHAGLVCIGLFLGDSLRLLVKNKIVSICYCPCLDFFC